MQFRNDIQGLRALAFILVFIFHLNSNWLPGGFIGVDIFFVISGFLISSIMLHQKNKGTFNFLSFYEKRIKRIVPAHFFMILLVAFFGFLIYLPSDIFALKESLIKSVLFISNRHFAGGESYFGAKFAENPLLHTWSLSIEMQFYFVLPLIIIFVKNRFLPYVVGGLFLIITGYTTYQLMTHGASPSTYFSLVSRMPEFFLGTLLAYLFSNKNFGRTTSLVMSVIGLLLIAASVLWIDENSLFPGALAVVPVLGTGLLLISGSNPISKFFASRPLVYIGELSYSLYLWHWPIMAFMRYRNGWAVPTPFSPAEVAVIIGLTILLSAISFYFVEEKFRHFTNKQFVVAFVPASLFIVCSIFASAHIKGNQQISGRFKRSEFGQTSHNSGVIELLGDQKSKKAKIFLFGDSHSLVMKYILHKVGLANSFSFSTLTCSSYPALKGVKQSEIPPNMVSHYFRSQKLIPITYQYIKNSDVIILNSIDFVRIPSVKIALVNLIKSLKPHQKLILLKTYQILDRDPVKVNGGYVKTSDTKINVINASNTKAFVTLLDTKYDNVFSYDLSEGDSLDDVPYYRDSVMYYDSNHLNLYGSTLLYKEINTKFNNFLNKVISAKNPVVKQVGVPNSI